MRTNKRYEVISKYKNIINRNTYTYLTRSSLLGNLQHVLSINPFLSS